MSAPTVTVAAPLNLELAMDALAYLLSTDSRTSNIRWILGDLGMGRPTKVPFGYISQVSDAILWYTANGSSGGLAAGGPNGLDDWQTPVTLTVAFENHRYIAPASAVPPANSPFNSGNNSGFVPPYQEQPGWRKALQINQLIKAVLRTNITILGSVTDTRIVESRWILQDVNNEVYRAARMTINIQQRRTRGD